MKNDESILNLIDDEEMMQVASDLVAIPSITHREGNGILTYLERWFCDLGIPVRLYPCNGGRANFFADYGSASNSERYLFNGHQDTKPVNGMTIDPFAGEIRNGRMYGRGACDMKGAIAAFLSAFKAIVRAGIKPQSGITFFSDIEEEYGGYDGFPSMFERGLLDGYEGMISGEPTELQVHIGNMGGLVTAFETEGKAVHSALPHLGVNAIHNMAHFISEYQKLPYLQHENPYFGKCTLNFEMIEGGLFDSTVPDRCITCIDTRIIPETPPEEVNRQVNDLMTRMNHEHGNSIREIDPPKAWRPRKGWIKACYIPPDHPLTKRVAKAVKRATGVEAVIGVLPGATLAGQMINKGTPAIICGPGSIAQTHTEDEWIEVDQILKAARIYAVLMADM